MSSSLLSSSPSDTPTSLAPSDSASQAFSNRTPLETPFEAPSESVTTKRRKLRALSTWEHFREAEGNEQRVDKWNNIIRYCRRCNYHTPISKNARRHLEKSHQIIVGGESRPNNKRQQAIENAFARQKSMQKEVKKEDEYKTLRSYIDHNAFREAQMLLSARRHLPFNFVTWPEYQALLIAINPTIEELLIDSGNTVADDLELAYISHKSRITQLLKKSLTPIHFAIDVWSSPNHKAFIAIHCQWVDYNYQPRKALLALPNLRRSHAGAAIEPHIMKTIRDHDLASNIGFFTGDNDAKNDTCLRKLAEDLETEYGVRFDPILSRTRCSGHIINLSLQAFLFASSEEALQAAINEAMEEANEITIVEALQRDKLKSKGKKKAKTDQSGWRSIGALGKLHNIAVFIRSSDIHGDVWEDIADRSLGIDNVTRWNSWFLLLDKAIEQQGAIMTFLQQYHDELQDDTLTTEDWTLLKITRDFLQPFYQATLMQEREWASIDQVLANMDILFKRFEDGKVSD
jgi:hypothetical protein